MNEIEGPPAKTNERVDSPRPLPRAYFDHSEAVVLAQSHWEADRPGIVWSGDDREFYVVAAALELQRRAIEDHAAVTARGAMNFRPLEWESDGKLFTADWLAGTYIIFSRPDGTATLRISRHLADAERIDYPNVASAQLAAQADYEGHVRPLVEDGSPSPLPSMAIEEVTTKDFRDPPRLLLTFSDQEDLLRTKRALAAGQVADPPGAGNEGMTHGLR